MSKPNVDLARQQWRELLETTAESVAELAAAEMQQLRRHWQQRYGGAEPAFLWHGFSFGHYPHLAGAPAVAAYEAQPVKSFLVFFEQPAVGFRCRGQRLPAWARLRELAVRGPAIGRDVYVTHPHLRWVCCLTHEADFGPYFARLSPDSPVE